MIYWWLNANRSYVERYLEYKRRLNPEFSIPSTYPDSKHSEIYQGFVYEQDASSGSLFTYMKWVYNEDLKIKIMDLVLLDKGTSYWESFFKNKIG